MTLVVSIDVRVSDAVRDKITQLLVDALYDGLIEANIDVRTVVNAKYLITVELR